MSYSLDYIGGFFDGEGCVAVYRSSKSGRSPGYSLRTQLAQNQNAVSDHLFFWLCDTYGGSVGKQITATGKTKLNWAASGSDAYEFLLAIHDHVHMKRKQVDVALAWHEQRPTLERDALGRITARSPEDVLESERVYDLLRALKKE